MTRLPLLHRTYLWLSNVVSSVFCTLSEVKMESRAESSTIRKIQKQKEKCLTKLNSLEKNKAIQSNAAERNELQRKIPHATNGRPSDNDDLSSSTPAGSLPIITSRSAVRGSDEGPQHHPTSTPVPEDINNTHVLPSSVVRSTGTAIPVQSTNPPFLPSIHTHINIEIANPGNSKTTAASPSMNSSHSDGHHRPCLSATLKSPGPARVAQPAQPEGSGSVNRRLRGVKVAIASIWRRFTSNSFKMLVMVGLLGFMLHVTHWSCDYVWLSSYLPSCDREPAADMLHVIAITTEDWINGTTSNERLTTDTSLALHSAHTRLDCWSEHDVICSLLPTLWHVPAAFQERLVEFIATASVAEKDWASFRQAQLSSLNTVSQALLALHSGLKEIEGDGGNGGVSWPWHTRGEGAADRTVPWTSSVQTQTRLSQISLQYLDVLDGQVQDHIAQALRLLESFSDISKSLEIFIQIIRFEDDNLTASLPLSLMENIIKVLVSTLSEYNLVYNLRELESFVRKQWTVNSLRSGRKVFIMYQTLVGGVCAVLEAELTTYYELQKEVTDTIARFHKPGLLRDSDLLLIQMAIFQIGEASVALDKAYQAGLAEWERDNQGTKTAVPEVSNIQGPLIIHY